MKKLRLNIESETNDGILKYGGLVKLKFGNRLVVTNMLGYSGRMAIVDLAQEKTKIEEIPEVVRKNFMGGSGYAIKFLYEHQKPRIDPLSPDNVLVFAVGPFCGTIIPCSAKSVIQAKSPLTGFQGESVGSSFWSLAFRRAGYDVLVIRGRAKKPSYLVIDDDVVELRDAKQLVGKDCLETERIIRETINDDNVQVAAIGPAGENLVRFASVPNDHGGASRTGMGAVMGSKQLKAVAVRGSKTVEVAKIDELVDLCDTYYKKIMSQDSSLMKDMGTVGTVIPNLSSYATPIRNFQSAGAFEGEESISEDIRNISMKWLKEQYVHKGISCASCPIACEHIAFIKEGEYKDIAYKTGYQAVYALGSNCGIRNFPAIVKAEQLCDTLGMDFISTGVIIAWAMECFEKGILTLKDTDGIELTFGNHEALIEMIPKIARREGLGNILAEGVKRASEKIGKNSNRFAMHSKGLEFAGFDVRVLKAAALSFAVSTKASFYEPEITVGHLEGLKVGKDLAKFVMEKENSLTILDMLMLCKFSVGTFPNSYNDLTRLYTLVTGARLNADELRSVAERIWNMEKVYNIREGWTRKDDSLPPKVFEPISDGGAKGSRLSEGEFNLLLNDYYAVRGWSSDGTPKKRKLGKMGLKAVAKEVGI